MELRHLRHFVKVAETENVSRAALRLHISQPAVSRQIRDLEDELGFALFKRNGKKVRLTEEGCAFLDQARAVLQRMDDAVRDVRALANQKQIELHIGYCSYAVDPLFHRIMTTYRNLMPKVRLKLHDRKVEESVDALLDGRLHLAFIFHAPKPGALRGLCFLPLSHEHPRLAVWPAHAFAARRAVSLKEAAQQPFVGLVPEEFPDSHYFIDQVFASTKTKPWIVEERDSMDGVIAAVEAGRGIALAADRYAHVFGHRIKIVRLIPEPKTIDIGLAARKGPLIPAAQKFWEVTKELVAGAE